MSPDTLEVRSHRLSSDRSFEERWKYLKFTAALVWDRINSWLPRIPRKSSLVGSLAGIGAAACMQQPPQVQEMPTPIIQVVTATPTEIPPTATSTPELPPTATPAPLRKEEPPKPVQENLFQPWGVYSGPLMPARGLESKGEIVIAPFPTEEILIFWMRKKDCDNNLKRESTNSFLVRRESRAGRGFSQTDRLGHVFSFAAIRPSLLGGNVKFRDDIPVAGVPNCKGDELSSQLELKGNGKVALGVELAAAKKRFSGGDNDPDAMIRLVQELCACAIPDPK